MAEQLQTIIQRCLRDEEKAQFELYKLLYSDLKSICCRYEKNHDDAMALMNAGYFRILSNLSKYNECKPFVPWAKRVQINVVLDQFRKNKAIKNEVNQMLSTDNIDIDPQVYNEIEEQIESEYIEQLIDALPQATKAVFNLHAVDGLSYKEIELELGISPNAIKWHVFNARKALKAKLMELRKTPKTQTVQ